jgi:hypothetical protein
MVAIDPIEIRRPRPYWIQFEDRFEASAVVHFFLNHEVSSDDRIQRRAYRFETFDSPRDCRWRPRNELGSVKSRLLYFSRNSSIVIFGSASPDLRFGAKTPSNTPEIVSSKLLPQEGQPRAFPLYAVRASKSVWTPQFDIQFLKVITGKPRNLSIGRWS